MDRSTTTQDSLPAAGQALPDGIDTRRVPLQRFQSFDYISSSFAKLRGAKTLLKLDPRDFELAVQQQQAAVRQRSAELKRSQGELARQEAAVTRAKAELALEMGQ